MASDRARLNVRWKTVGVSYALGSCFVFEGIGMNCRNRLQDLIAKSIRELTSKARKMECGSRSRLRSDEESGLERALNA
jgi:hypothetical protein